LLSAAAQTLREDGLAAASARTIAARAQANQALIFYHFGTVSQLLEAASQLAVDESVGYYRARFAAVTSLTELLALGRGLHERERADGNVALMAQVMSGAQHDPVLARAARYALSAWTAEIDTVLSRVLAGNPLAELADPAGLARAVSAGFIGLELYEGVDAEGAAQALAALETLGVLIDVMDDLGPLARRAVRSALSPRRARSSRAPKPAGPGPRG
jgi:AcrR family transcriptional regulator